jgi:ABC-type transporter Mla subunit MlaD
MPGSFADFVDDWQHLVSAIDSHQEQLEGLGTARATLASLVQSALEKSALQKQLKTQGEDMTDQMRETLEQGNDLARDIRSQIRGKLGSRSLLLKEFRVAPLVKKRRTKPAPPPVEIAETVEPSGSVESS